MSSPENTLLSVQLEGLEPTPPNYEYGELTIPTSLVVNGLFASHEDIGALGADEIEDQRRFLREHDIVVIEASHLTPQGKKGVLKVVKGDYREYQKFLRHLQLSSSDPLTKNWTSVSTRVIYNIGRPVFIVDPPHGHTSYRGTENWNGDYTPPGLGFSEAIDAMRKQKLAYAEANLERENYMLASFVEQIGELTTSNPRFKRKVEEGERISVCIWAFGITHAGIYEGIKEVVHNSGHDSEGAATIFTANDTSINYHGQIVSRFMRGLEIDDTLIARNVVFGMLYRRETQRQSETIPQYEARLMQTIDPLSLDELEKLYQDLSV